MIHGTNGDAAVSDRSGRCTQNSRAALEAFYYGWLLEEVEPEKREVFLEVLETLYARSKQARREENRPLIQRLNAEEMERNETDERG